MVTGNFKIAFDSIKAYKWRSFLTMLGIIIGVVSVVTIVSIGEGVKKQISNQIGHMGPDLITVRPGKPVTRNNSGHIDAVNFMSGFVGNSLTENDVQAIKKTPNIAKTVPMSFVSGTPRADGRTFERNVIFGTTEDLPAMLNQDVEYGEFFQAHDADKNVVVIGKSVAEELFQETVPVGRSMQIRGENFVVRGVFEEFATAKLTPNADYNAAVFMPINVSKKLSNNQTNIQQILAKPTDPTKTNEAVKSMQKQLLNTHAGQDDFTILKQEDNLAIANTILNLLTGLITGVAAISLLVGGIGIMNIMLVAVTERTQEIGIRKAVGATNSQIMSQFVIEAAVISLTGGVVGIFGSLLANFFIRVTTDLEPVITLPIMGLALAVSLIVGIFFGSAPALQAARKDPIEALRKI
jgi:putative ABC transport system permease protein